MIIYELTCTGGHRFEGWFGSADDFESQRSRALVRCPVCDDDSITKVPFANVHRGKAAVAQDEAATSADRPPATREPSVPVRAATGAALAGLPAELVKHLRDMVRKAEDVGTRFPEEARKMHYDESPARAIRGRASAEEAESLRDEGIEFASLPPFLVEDTH